MNIKVNIKRQINENLSGFPIDKTIFYGSLLFFAAYSLLLLHLGEKAHFIIHDQLDSEFLWRTLLAKDTGPIIQQIMCGLPRSVFPSDYNIQNIFYLFFPPFWAFIINELTLRAIAYWGTIQLGKKLTPHLSVGLLALVALFFSLTPAYYSVYGLSVAGQPLILLSILNIYHKRHWLISSVFIALYAFYSPLVLVGVFIIGLSAITLMIYTFYSRKIHWYGLSSWLILVGAYVIAEQALITLTLSPEFLAHRVEFLKALPVFSKQIILFFKQLLTTQYHTGRMLTSGIVCTVLVASWLHQAQHSTPERKYIKYLSWLMLSAGIFVSLYPYLVYYGRAYFPFIAQFQFIRIYFLFPCAWLVLLLLSLSLIVQRRKRKLAYCLIAFQIFLGLALEPQFRSNIKQVAAGSMTISPPNFQNYFSVKLFDQIKEALPADQSEYKVVGLGISPSILQYNGFYTLDGYQNLYPLSYKKRFRKLMAKELDKSERWRHYYDNWGNRAYLLASELSVFNRYKHLKPQELNLDFDPTAFKELGGHYIFSAVKISNDKDNHLDFIASFTNDHSLWEIYIYEVRSLKNSKTDEESTL